MPAKIRGHVTSSVVEQNNVVPGRTCPLIFALTYQATANADVSKIRIAEVNERTMTKMNISVNIFFPFTAILIMEFYPNNQR